MNGSFLVARNGQIIFERYNGYANKNEGTKITADTPVQIASVSKVLTATVVLKLVNAGKLDLDQKVNTILKTFPYEDCTVRMLLSHRSVCVIMPILQITTNRFGTDIISSPIKTF
jgi:CubicO group peptidase (beta-lactamase class C family)